MIKDLNLVIKSTEESAVAITSYESQLSTIFSLFYMKSKKEKEIDINNYTKLLNLRIDEDESIENAIDYHTAIAKALESMKFSPKDRKVHNQRIKSMIDMIKQDNFQFSSNKEEPEEQEEPKKKGLLGFLKK